MLRLAIFASVLSLPLTTSAQSIVVDSQTRHLRSGVQREWSRFPAKAEGDRSDYVFEATKNTKPATLTIRQADVRLNWEVSLNGKRIGRLRQDENDMVYAWSLPVGALRDGVSLSSSNSDSAAANSGRDAYRRDVNDSTIARRLRNTT